ncbi:MAG: aminodeoxychorismate lyase, partial [Flammeovirgaceae bacterium]
MDIKKIKLVAFLVGSILLITFTFYFYQIIYTPNILVDRDDRLFQVKSGATYQSVLNDLGKANFVNDMVSFAFLAKLNGLDKELKP